MTLDAGFKRKDLVAKRKVRTAAGAKKFHAPIGTPITRAMRVAARLERKGGLNDGAKGRIDQRVRAIDRNPRSPYTVDTHNMLRSQGFSEAEIARADIKHRKFPPAGLPDAPKSPFNQPKDTSLPTRELPGKHVRKPVIPAEEIDRIQHQPGKPVKVKNGEEAVAELMKGNKVELPTELDVSIMLDGLRAEVQKAKDAGKDAPVINLCNVTVKGSSLFCVNSKGIPRVQMPQLSGVPTPGSKADKLSKDDKGEVSLNDLFEKHLVSKGVKVTKADIPATSLKASQNELNGGKVAGITGAIEAGKYKEVRLFVSRDNYVVDGHHRWAATIGADLRDGVDDKTTIPVNQIDMGILDILIESNKFAAEWGIPQASVAKMLKKRREEILKRGFPNPDSRGSKNPLKDGNGHTEAWYLTHPNKMSSPKDILGHHGHHPHGPSIYWPALYEHLRAKGMTKAKAAAISNSAWKKKKVGLPTNTPTSVRGVVKDDHEIGEGRIIKIEEDQQTVFGWAYVTHDQLGELNVDKSGEFVDDPEELEKAAYNFVLKERTGDADHTNVVKSTMVESMVFTPEKIEALGLKPGDLPVGWWTGWKIHDADLWQGVKKGYYTSFSIYGRSLKKVVDSDEGR